jgi:N-carbamoylputrescine amidase
VIASNRIGEERGESCDVTFYGSSFITDHTGAKLSEAGRTETAVLIAEVDLKAMRKERVTWGLFRDRRPDLYGDIMHLDGTS